VSDAVADIGVASSEVAFVIVDGDIYRSMDAGETWSAVLSPHSRKMQSLVVSPAFAADRAVIATDGAGRVFRSVDGGAGWSQIGRVAALGGASDVPVWLAISPDFAADRALYACSFGAAYHSADGGATWQPFDSGLELGPDECLSPGPALAVAPRPAVRAAELPDTAPHPALAAAARDGLLLVAAPQGVFRSVDGGATWQPADAGLPRAPVSAAASTQDGALVAVCGGRLFRLPAGAERWEPLGLPPGAEGSLELLAVSGSPPVIFVSAGKGLFVSRDGGAAWESITLPGSLGAGSFALYPSVDFAANGTAHVLPRQARHAFQTRDGGRTWAEVPLSPRFSRLVEAPDGRWIAFEAGVLHAWAPGGNDTWVYAASPMRVPDDVLFLTRLDAVAVAAGADSDGDGGVWFSRDGGLAWAREGGDWSGLRVILSPRFDADRALYAQDGAAVLVSTDLGATWAKAGAGLPPCEADSPECGVEQVWAVRRGEGYVVYALARRGWHVSLWQLGPGQAGTGSAAP
jgi:photosystem II stability/assembly factor-like uncharacterized protein